VQSNRAEGGEGSRVFTPTQLL